MSKDPIGFAGDGPNLYAYVLNNPVNIADPKGLKSAGYGGWEVQFIIGGGTAIVTCCDGQNLRKLKYRKICLGAGFTGGISGGAAFGSQGASCKSPPPFFFSAEFGISVVEGGISIYKGGLSPFVGGSASVGGKSTACYYWLVSNEKRGCCGNG